MNKFVSILLFFGIKVFRKNITIIPWKPFFISRSAMLACKKNGRIIINGRIRLEAATEIESKGLVILGKNVIINKYSRIMAHEKIELGSNILIARFVSILDHDHAYAMEKGTMKMNGYHTKPVKIGSNVWIGDKVTILKGVTIGDNVIIAANTVVNKDVPSNTIIAGTSFRVVKQIL